MIRKIKQGFLVPRNWPGAKPVLVREPTLQPDDWPGMEIQYRAKNVCSGLCACTGLCREPVVYEHDNQLWFNNRDGFKTLRYQGEVYDLVKAFDNSDVHKLVKHDSQ